MRTIFPRLQRTPAQPEQGFAPTQLGSARSPLSRELLKLRRRVAAAAGGRGGAGQAASQGTRALTGYVCTSLEPGAN